MSLRLSVVLILAAAVFAVCAINPGMLSSSKTERIAGGVPTTPAEFPYIVDVMAGGAIGYIHYCNGIVLSPTWVLVSASCAQLPLYYYVIFSGDHDNSTGVFWTFVHPQYDEETQANDIGLLRLLTPLVFGDTVQAAVLPEPGFSPTGDVTIAAWDSANRMYKTTLPLVSNEECNFLYENSTRFSITDSMICAGGEGDGPCEDDYGGPMICDNNGEPVLCGSLSWRQNGCLDEDLPGVGNRISEYRQWIDAHINAPIL